MTTMQRQRDAEKVAKGRAILAKFYQVLKDDATNMDDLVGACIVVAPLLAFVITRIHPGDRPAQLATVNTIAGGVCELLDINDPDATATLQ